MTTPKQPIFKHPLIQVFAALLIFLNPVQGELPDLDMKAKDTVTIVELNSGEVLNFTLVSGRTVRLELIESRSEMVFTTLDQIKEGDPEQRSIYRMICRVRIDGQEMEMVRYNPVQQAFYEPWMVNGLHIWFDGLQSLKELFNEAHGTCLPTKEARFALQDATLGVCPQPMGNWLPLGDHMLHVRDAYGGEDTWMGPYFGADLHGGLDISVPANTTLYAPIDFDDQFYFNSLAKGDNNNRWRGIREWPNGDVWHLQTHHLMQPLVDEHTPLKRGQPYAFAGGVRAGYTAHIHFVLKALQPGMDMLMMDPWILFWEIFRNNEEKSGTILARMEPLPPTRTGEPVNFSSMGSRNGTWGEQLDYHWDFGDGFTSAKANPRHVYLQPGVFPVSLLVSDGADTAVVTQHLTVNGDDLTDQGIRVSSEYPHAFQKQKSWKTRASGDPVQSSNRLVFHRYRKQRGDYHPIEILLTPGADMSPRNLADSTTIDIAYVHGNEWLEVAAKPEGDALRVTVQPKRFELLFEHGFYVANVSISNPAALNAPIEFEVLVDLRFSNPEADVIVTHSGINSERSRYFWIAPEFHLSWVGGASGNYLINGRPTDDEYVSFRPNLVEGNYRVSLYGKPYAEPEIMERSGTFTAIVRHRDGISEIRVDPAKSLELGVFPFSTGRRGVVEIISTGAEGLVVVDAVRFSRVDESSGKTE